MFFEHIRHPKYIEIRRELLAHRKFHSDIGGTNQQQRDIGFDRLRFHRGCRENQHEAQHQYSYCSFHQTVVYILGTDRVTWALYPRDACLPSRRD